MANVPVYKKDRSKHNELMGKLRSVRHEKAVQMAVHLMMGGTSKTWSLSDDQSTITHTTLDDVRNACRAYSLSNDLGRIEVLIAERTEANAKRADEKAKADADVEAPRIQTENDYKAKADAEAATQTVPSVEPPTQAPVA